MLSIVKNSHKLLIESYFNQGIVSDLAVSITKRDM